MLVAPHRTTRPSPRGLLGVALVCLAGVSALASASAEVIYDNGAPTSLVPTGFEMTAAMEADDFTITEPVRIDSIRFRDVEIQGGFSGTFFWRIYANTDQDQPGAVLAEPQQPVAPTQHELERLAPPYNEWVNTLPITPVVLQPGTYWLGLHNGPLSDFTLRFVFWEATDETRARTAQQNLGPDFNDNEWNSVAAPGRPSELTFQLYGVVIPRAVGVRRAQGTFHFSFTTRQGSAYRIEYNDSLNPQTWQPLPGAATVSGTGAIVEVADPNSSGLTHRFYRAVLL